MFFLIDPPTSQIYTLSLHDALPIFRAQDPRHDHRPSGRRCPFPRRRVPLAVARETVVGAERDRKSTCLNSSHQIISYAVFCLKKKKISCTLTHLQTTKCDTSLRCMP